LVQAVTAYLQGEVRIYMSVNPWNDTRQHAITEVQARIRAVYPDATFRLVEGEDPIGLYLDAYTDAEDAFAVLDLVSDWLVDLSVNAGVHLHVIPLPQEAAAPHISKQQ
jgi:hypothetical protein